MTIATPMELKRPKDLPQATDLDDGDFLIIDRPGAGLFKISVGQFRMQFTSGIFQALGPSGDYEPEGVLMGARPMEYMQYLPDGSVATWKKLTGTAEQPTNTGWILTAKYLPRPTAAGEPEQGGDPERP
jgi:hypothetical protein